MAIQDFNRDSKGDFVKSSNVSKNRVYSDLDLLMPIHNERDDIVPLKDIEAVKQSVKNLVLTNFFERPFHPEIGGNVTAKLFEPADSFTGIAIREEIKQVITDFEPRVNGLKIEVFDDSDANTYIVNIGFNVINLQVETEVSFNLQRLR